MSSLLDADRAEHHVQVITTTDTWRRIMAGIALQRQPRRRLRHSIVHGEICVASRSLLPFKLDACTAGRSYTIIALHRPVGCAWIARRQIRSLGTRCRQVNLLDSAVVRIGVGGNFHTRIGTHSARLSTENGDRARIGVRFCWPHKRRVSIRGERAAHFLSHR